MRCGSVVSVIAVLAGMAGPMCDAVVFAGAATPESQQRAARRKLEVDAFPLLSRERLFTSLRQLTAIGSSTLFRNSASRGEAEAREYIAARLSGLVNLQALGMEVERQSFRTFLAAEVWEARLVLTVGGREVEVPTHALSGNRENLALALRFDSDGVLNDADRNPVVVQGPALLLRSAAEINAVPGRGLRGRIALVDYGAVDRSIMTFDQAVANATALLATEPAGVVLVTSFSNRRGDSHGSFVGDLSVLVSVSTASAPPMLYVRLEDLAPAGIAGWGGLSSVEAVRLVWDEDIFSPGSSGNVIARIPGADRSKAVILGAHLDSPNSPGALDNGSGTVVLLEVARVLDATRVRPPVDLYLCWFGSHERGLYGSSNFLSTHQELLDRTIAMLQVDCLSRPLDGIHGSLYLEAWPYGRFGDPRLTWPNYLSQVARDRGTEAIPLANYGIVSDNSGFVGYDVPSADLIFMNPYEMQEVHYDGHLHDPYDTADLALDEADALEAMARIALAAALRTGRDNPSLRVTPRPDRRAVFVASHTEPPHMTPAALTDLGMALAWEGFDVDTVPYGHTLSQADLEGASLVVALPVLDYPSVAGDVTLYDEAWDAGEVAALQAYVARGGLLVLTNSGNRLKYANQVLEPNEHWSGANAVGASFGISFSGGALAGSSARTSGGHALIQGVSELQMVPGNGVPFSVRSGQVLASAGSQPVVALVGSGTAGGQVLVLADLGILGSAAAQPANLQFWRNLARFARSH
jgi:hypothetical protein